MAAFQGKLSKTEPVGEYDLYLMLADRYRWTPDQINAMTPDYLEEVRARIQAEGIVAEERRKAEARRRKHEEWVKARRRPHGTDVDISEIT